MSLLIFNGRSNTHTHTHILMSIIWQRTLAPTCCLYCASCSASCWASWTLPEQGELCGAHQRIRSPQKPWPGALHWDWLLLAGRSVRADWRLGERKHLQRRIRTIPRGSPAPSVTSSLAGLCTPRPWMRG